MLTYEEFLNSLSEENVTFENNEVSINVDNLNLKFEFNSNDFSIEKLNLYHENYAPVHYWFFKYCEEKTFNKFNFLKSNNNNYMILSDKDSNKLASEFKFIYDMRIEKMKKVGLSNSQINTLLYYDYENDRDDKEIYFDLLLEKLYGLNTRYFEDTKKIKYLINLIEESEKTLIKYNNDSDVIYIGTNYYICSYEIFSHDIYKKMHQDFIDIRLNLEYSKNFIVHDKEFDKEFANGIDALIYLFENEDKRYL